MDDKDTKIRGGTGLREWSAPETRLSLFTDLTIDCWTLGCIMFLLSTGKQPFNKNDNITVSFNFAKELSDYSESETFPIMVDFISKLLETDPTKRMTAKEALLHPWLQATSQIKKHNHKP